MPPRCIAIGLAVIFLFLTAGLSQATDAWWDTDWLNRTKITFDNSDQTTSNLDDFPAPVTLNITNLTSLDLGATVDGDVRLRNTLTGAEIKYEVAAYDAESRSVPSILKPYILSL